MSGKKCFEVEEVENGFSVVIRDPENGDESLGYVEPKKYIAKDKAEVITIFNKEF